jgi:hypothetical protein
MKKAKYALMITLLGVVLFGVGFYLMKAFAQPQGILKTLPYLCIGIGCGAFGHGFGDLLNRKILKKDPAAARQMTIDINDERNVMHANMAKAKGYNLMINVFAALMLAYAFMGETMEVLLSLIAAYFSVQIYALYHRLKIDKEQ